MSTQLHDTIREMLSEMPTWQLGYLLRRIEDLDVDNTDANKMLTALTIDELVSRPIGLEYALEAWSTDPDTTFTQRQAVLEALTWLEEQV